MKKTLVLGANPNPERYAYRATEQLKKHGHMVIPVGIRKGKIADIEIEQGMPVHTGIDTVTLYLSADNQKSYYDYILSLKPKRLIFNPGTENLELQKRAQAAGIETEIACTLVMLSIGNY